MKRKPNKPLLGALVAVELVAAKLAWRDLAKRGDAQVRGNKNAWRILILLNPGNSLVYWGIGRV
jgi:hypothetical protein